MRKNDLAPLVLLFALLIGFAACNGGGGGGSSSSGWDMPLPGATNVVPQSGAYSFSQQGCFLVTADGAYVRFSRDCLRYDLIPIINGAFTFTHGEIGGTNCPTDSYSIAGTFSDSTHASGKISYAYNCQITQSSLTFVAVKR